MCENQYFSYFDPKKSITTWVSEIPVQYRFLRMLPIRNISYLSPMWCNFWEKCTNSHKIGLGCSTPLRFTLSFVCFCLFVCLCVGVFVQLCAAEPDTMVKWNMNLITWKIVFLFFYIKVELIDVTYFGVDWSRSKTALLRLIYVDKVIPGWLSITCDGKHGKQGEVNNQRGKCTIDIRYII